MTSAALISPLPLGRMSEGEQRLLSDVDEVAVFVLPMTIRFRGVTHREGLLLRGPQGWGECAPFPEYGAKESARWLASAVQCATVPMPTPIRSRVPVNVTIPVCDPDEARRRIFRQRGCSTAKVKVADPGHLLEEDAVRVRTVSLALAERYGEEARVRIDANTAWSVDEAAMALEYLNEAADAVGGLEYAEQPVRTVKELARLRKMTSVPLAADESIRRSAHPLAVRDEAAVDVAVVKVAPLGGVESAHTLVSALGLPCAVSSALDTSVGIAAGVALAASLPSLPFACGLNTVTMFGADVVNHPLIASDGYLDVEEAKATRTGSLTSTAFRVERAVIERWRRRLRFMAQALEDHDEAESLPW